MLTYIEVENNQQKPKPHTQKRKKTVKRQNN